MTPEAKNHFQKFAKHFNHTRLAKILQEKFDRMSNEQAKTQNPAQSNPNAQAGGQDNRAGVVEKRKDNR